MRVLIAFDKFKFSLAADDACRVAAAEIARLHPDWEIDCAPLADGGDGFARVLTESADGSWETLDVTGARGSTVRAAIGWVSAGSIAADARALLELPPLADDAKVAVIELAAASGIALIGPSRRDPWRTSTRGTGELLAAAAQRGAGAIVLGLGGSATNDLALGALCALGWRMIDAEGNALASPVPARWSGVTKLLPPGDTTVIGAMPAPRAVTLPPLRLACDVTNPLLGPHGATATFGPQKGLEATDVDALDAAVGLVARMLADAAGRDFASASEHPGAGAAGGAAFGLMVGCGAKLISGSGLVDAWLDLRSRIERADLVITGEGAFDATSLDGKGPGALLQRAVAAGKPVEVFAGRLGDIPRAAIPIGVKLHAISSPELPLAVALKETRERLAAAVSGRFGD